MRAPHASLFFRNPNSAGLHRNSYGQGPFRLLESADGICCRHDLEPAGSRKGLRRSSGFARSDSGPVPFRPGHAAGTGARSAVPSAVPGVCCKRSGCAPAAASRSARSAGNPHNSSAACGASGCGAPGHNLSTGQFTAALNRPATLIFISIYNCNLLVIRARAEEASAFTSSVG